MKSMIKLTKCTAHTRRKKVCVHKSKRGKVALRRHKKKTHLNETGQ